MVRRLMGIVAVLASLSFVSSARAQHDPPHDGGMGKHDDMPARNMHAGYFGVMIGPVDEDAAKEQNLDTQSGVLVMKLLPGAPADKGGIKVNDIIRKVDDKEIDDNDDFIAVMDKTKPEQVVKFTLMRDGKEQEVTVTLGVRPADMGKQKLDDDEKKDDDDKKGPPSTQPGK